MYVTVATPSCGFVVRGIPLQDIVSGRSCSDLQRNTPRAYSNSKKERRAFWDDRIDLTAVEMLFRKEGGGGGAAMGRERTIDPMGGDIPLLLVEHGGTGN